MQTKKAELMKSMNDAIFDARGTMNFLEAAAETGRAFKFCPSCASPRLHSVAGRMWICPDCGFEYFHNVATAAGIVVDVGGSIILLRRAKAPRKGMSALPGGFIEPGERAEDGALRECSEELGWKPDRIEFLASFPNIYRYRGIPYATCDLYFYTRVTDPETVEFEANPGEVAEILRVPADAIPWDDIAFESTRNALREYV